MTFPGWEVTTRHVLASFLLHVRYGVMCLIIHVKAGGVLDNPRLGWAQHGKMLPVWGGRAWHAKAARTLCSFTLKRQIQINEKELG